MIDAMKIRKHGTPQAPFLMKTVMVSIRVGTAAYFAGKDARNMLGRYGHILKYFFEFTRGKNVILRAVLKSKNSRRLIGIGGQYIVLLAQDPAYIEKYSHTLAGADLTVLELMLDVSKKEHERMVAHFGDLIQPTEYDMARLPIRGPAKKLLTLRARQELLRNRFDIFSTEAQKLLMAPDSSALRQDMHDLHARIMRAMNDNVWLDIIGPENVIITTDSGEPRIRILDIEPYVPEYLTVYNPMTGKTYKDAFMERLKNIEQMCAQLPAEA